jgi:hypothetical protein
MKGKVKFYRPVITQIIITIFLFPIERKKAWGFVLAGESKFQIRNG